MGRDPRNWRTNVPHYAKVRYESMYPGVDKVFYANDGKLEYDLVVAPRASPHAIRFALEGADRMSLNDEGDLLLETPLGTVVQRKPVAFQEIDGRRQAVSAKYRLLAANQVAFDLGRYDPDHTLVIDPVLVYSTYVTGSSASLSHGISISRCGEAFIAGYTVAADFPTTPGAFDPTPVPGTRMGFVAKLNQAGTGLLKPFSSQSPRLTRSKAAPLRALVAPSTTTCPGAATPCRREAKFGVSPDTVPLQFPGPASRLPATTRPVAMPTRLASGLRSPSGKRTRGTAWTAARPARRA